MIAILDYGLGNVKAFAQAYHKMNIPSIIVKQPDDLKSAKKIILPGVGSFDHAIQLLDQSGLRVVLDKYVLEYCIPVLGICVGMQIMAKSSEEGKLPGLRWIDADVKKLEVSARNGEASDNKYYEGVRCLPLPHMGWNDVKPENNKLFEGLMENARFYFLHSYYFNVTHKKDVIAVSEYGSLFPCAVNVGNIYGVQFHPEKSHHFGIKLLRNFALL